MKSPKKKTTTKIKESLIELLQKSQLDELSVTELCERAQINRTTFYYHYDSVQNVFNELEKQLEEEFTAFLSKPTVSGDGKPEKSFYITFFEFVERNAGICRIMLNAPHTNDHSFLARAMIAGRDKVISVMTRLFPNCPIQKIDYYYIFVSNGFLGLLSYWLNTGMNETVEQLAEIGETISHNGIQYLL